MSESNPRPSFMQRDTDYAIGTYADVSKMDNLKTAVEQLYHNIIDDAVKDGRDPDEAQSLAHRAVMQLINKQLGELAETRPRGPRR